MGRSGRRDSRYRKSNIKEKLPRILIVCEGERTEPLYFAAFPVVSCVVKPIGVGMNTVTLVEYAANYLQEDRDFQQVWCVFDKDSFPDSHFREAVEIADALNTKLHRNGIRFRTAYSNQAFELWYVLHFCYLHGQIDRDGYKKILSRELGRKYEKNDARMYTILLDRQQQAIRFARKLVEEVHTEEYDPVNRFPCTLVYELVEELNKHVRA